MRARATGPHWYAKWYRNGRPVIRALGRAWVVADGHGCWRPRRGRPQDGALTEAQASERMLALVREHDAVATRDELDADARRRDGITFRELAAEYLIWLGDVKDAKPKTLGEHRYLLVEPGTPHKRGGGRAEGRIMAALGDLPAREITTRDVEALLRSVARTGVAPRTVNKTRQLVCAIFNYGTAYTGLRRGELVTLRWRDVDFARQEITVRRALSGPVEVTSTKSRRAREVPLPDQAAAALDRVSRRDDFTGPDDYVFASRLGRRLDPSALRRRFERARDAAGLEPLRFHDLRHTYGSLLVAGGIDLASVKAAMGHARITTTERYLHARPASEQAARFTQAFASVSVPVRAGGSKRRGLTADAK